jgi:hypothetical protein
MQQAPDCDMVLVHDDDLERIDWIGKGIVRGALVIRYRVRFLSCLQLPESLRPEVVRDLFQRSSLEIHKACCGELSTTIKPRTYWSS